METSHWQIKRALENKKITFGSWIQIGHPAVAEVLASTGLDWLAVDGEHSDIELQSLSNIFRALNGTACEPLVRVKENDTLCIRQALDAGAHGIIVPFVNSAAEAEKAVRAAKYPPVGVRGFSFSRCNRWGVDFESYAATANQNTAVIVMIESEQAVQNIESILRVQGVDGVFIGPYDMSGSFGILGQTTHPIMLNAYKKILAACHEHQKSAGLHIVLPDQDAISKAIRDGFTFIALGMDNVFMYQGALAALNFAKEVG
ncbi:2,4-dihydroxyhept-2-ene-1,7-dioic acid aldolase [candidate division KSB1 bacterium]|nr:2,4-dihydroxyhept-2-ene-1,7-dioic acid aldolase [candidate division KSB1 bacterium]